jgi:hypothetical protein
MHCVVATGRCHHILLNILLSLAVAAVDVAAVVAAPVVLEQVRAFQ